MRALLLLALLAAFPTSAFAQSPTDEQIPYQGVLSDNGAPLADGLKSLDITLSDANGGSWTETATVTTTDGAFAHRIGSVETITGIDFSLPVSITTVYTPSPGVTITFGPTALGAVPTARFAQNAGTVSFPLAGTAPSAGGTLQLTNTGSGDGLRVANAGDDGIQISSAGGDGLFVSSAGEEGLDIANAGSHGIFVENTALDGVRVANPTEDGLHIETAGDDGIEIATATNNGIDVGTSGSNGLLVSDAGFNGVWVEESGNRGVEVDYASDIGVFVFRSGDTDANGTPDVNRDGVSVGWAGGDGVQVSRASAYGVRATGDDGNYLRTQSTVTLAPDLILGGTANSAAGDNAVLTTDPAYSSSDMFVVSNDAVVFYIDNDEDAETGEFEVRNGANTLLFRVLENGTITPFGGTYGAENAVRIDDPSAPSARAITLPSVVSSERLVAFSGNVVTDGSGSAVVELPDYADAVAGDFRYQLTVIGSFAQAIVGSEVSGGRFTVRTSEPGVKVSWRVEGTRQDAWARANDHTDVAAKAQPGTYLHPTLFGAAPSAQAISGDGPSQITPEGQARIDAEAAELAETEQSVVNARAARAAERQQDAARAAQRTRDAERD